jgi:hypothetical protein
MHLPVTCAAAFLRKIRAQKEICSPDYIAVRIDKYK